MADLTNDVEETEMAVEEISEAAEGVVQATKDPPHNIDFILDVTLQVSVEVGRCRMSVQDLLQLGQGSVVELSKLAGEPLDIYINERHIARGEAVIVNEKFGVRITDILSQAERIEELG